MLRVEHEVVSRRLEAAPLAAASARSIPGSEAEMDGPEFGSAGSSGRRPSVCAPPSRTLHSRTAHLTQHEYSVVGQFEIPAVRPASEWTTGPYEPSQNDNASATRTKMMWSRIRRGA